LELQKSKRTFEEIEVLQQANLWNGVASRLYYAVFHAVNALLIHDAHQANTHNGSHAMFGLHYIKTGKLPAEYGRLYNQLQTMREESDYNCVYNVEREEIMQRILPARQMIDAISKMINNP